MEPTAHGASESLDVIDITPLIQGREKTYYYMLVVVQVLAVAFMVVATFGIGLIYLLGFLAFAGIGHGLLVGSLRGSAVRIDEGQFPDLHERITRLGHRIGLKRIPEAYIVQGNGLLNAFATHYFGRRYVVLYSDIVEPAYEQGSASVDFVIVHELAHHRRGHVTKRLLLWPATFTPFLFKAWSRACEYTCDRIAVTAVPEAGGHGLALLASGKRLYGRMDMGNYSGQVQRLGGFWTWVAEVVSTHPHLSKRILSVRAVGSPTASIVPSQSGGTSGAVI